MSARSMPGASRCEPPGDGISAAAAAGFGMPNANVVTAGAEKK
ncbi:MAG TPA: hypothetical protein VLS27_09160 [Gammaproteobacteria bacterium]|nr:hypothetical protein [Gammaproteobacteria bacterium]